MKTIDYYLDLPYKLEIVPDKDEGGFAARYPELPGCITVGDTLESVVKNANDAKTEWITAALEDGNTIPEPSTYDDYSGQFKLRLPKSLHKLLADKSKEEGVSMNQYCVYLLSMNNSSNLYKHRTIR